MRGQDTISIFEKSPTIGIRDRGVFHVSVSVFLERGRETAHVTAVHRRGGGRRAIQNLITEPSN